MPKSKYETHVLPYMDKIALWASKGASQAEIAGKLNLGVSTFKKYLSLGEKGEEPYVDLVDCFAQAREEPDDEVEAALFKKAIGYNAKVAKHYKVKRVDYDPDNGRKISEREELVVVYDEVHVAADTTAQMFYLANRRPNKWKYKPEPVDEDGESGGVVVLAPVMENPGPPKEAGDG